MRCLLGGRCFILPQQCGGDFVMSTLDSKMCFFGELDHVAHPSIAIFRTGNIYIYVLLYLLIIQ